MQEASAAAAKKTVHAPGERVLNWAAISGEAQNAAAATAPPAIPKNPLPAAIITAEKMRVADIAKIIEAAMAEANSKESKGSVPAARPRTCGIGYPKKEILPRTAEPSPNSGPFPHPKKESARVSANAYAAMNARAAARLELFILRNSRAAMSSAAFFAIKFVAYSTIHYQSKNRDKQQNEPEHFVHKAEIFSSETFDQMINPEYRKQQRRDYGSDFENSFEMHRARFALRFSFHCRFARRAL
jgi:hypothetical protein